MTCSDLCFKGVILSSVSVGKQVLVKLIRRLVQQEMLVGHWTKVLAVESLRNGWLEFGHNL